MENDKRKNCLSWDGYFMGIAALASFRSKDPNTQNGAHIIDPILKTTLSIGYNGLPRGCDDNEFPWCREAENENDTKYPYSEHSERNAIYNAARRGIALDNSVMYLYSERAYYPCKECARAIIQSDIKEVIMASAIDENTDKYDWTPTKRMFDKAKTQVTIMNEKFIDDTILMYSNFLKIHKKLVENDSQKMSKM